MAKETIAKNDSISELKNYGYCYYHNTWHKKTSDQYHKCRSMGRIINKNVSLDNFFVVTNENKC